MLIWMEIASHNYNPDRYRCYIGILVTRPDGGVNEPAADSVSCRLSARVLVKRKDVHKSAVLLAQLKNKLIKITHSRILAERVLDGGILPGMMCFHTHPHTQTHTLSLSLCRAGVSNCSVQE